MKRVLPVVAPVLGLLIAAAAATVAVRSWLAERSLAAGTAAQSRGDLRGAAEAYGRARERGSVDGTLALARLAYLRRSWAEAEAFVAEAAARAPARGYPHLLLASILLARPGDWDRAREDRVLGECRTSSLLEPAAWSLLGECGGILLDLAALRQGAWDAARREAVRREAVEAYAGAIALVRRQEPSMASIPGDRRPSRLLLAAAAARGAGGETLAEISRAAGAE